MATDQIDRMRADVEALCVSPRHTAEDVEAHGKAADYIASELEAAGCDVERQEFSIPAEPERDGLNIIGTMTANADQAGSRTLVIGAHYDTVAGSPGADDNASGVAVMLECARALARLERRRPVVFVAFDAEEKQTDVGLFGSAAFVKSLVDAGRAREVAGAYVLEMVGYSAPAGGQKVPAGLQLAFPRAFDKLRDEQFAGNSVVVISDRQSRAISRELEAASRSVSEGVIILPMEVPRWLPTPHNLLRSDHAPFWQAGIPAVMIGDTANFRNPNYHAPTDTPETLDFSLISRVANSLSALAIKHVTREERRRPRRR